MEDPRDNDKPKTHKISRRNLLKAAVLLTAGEAGRRIGLVMGGALPQAVNPEPEKSAEFTRIQEKARLKLFLDQYLKPGNLFDYYLTEQPDFLDKELGPPWKNPITGEQGKDQILKIFKDHQSINLSFELEKAFGDQIEDLVELRRDQFRSSEKLETVSYLQAEPYSNVQAIPYLRVHRQFYSGKVISEYMEFISDNEGNILPTVYTPQSGKLTPMSATEIQEIGRWLFKKTPNRWEWGYISDVHPLFLPFARVGTYVEQAEDNRNRYVQIKIGAGGNIQLAALYNLPNK